MSASILHPAVLCCTVSRPASVVLLGVVDTSLCRCMGPVLSQPSVSLYLLSVKPSPAVSMFFQSQPALQFVCGTCHAGVYPSTIASPAPPPCSVNTSGKWNPAGYRWESSPWCIPGALPFPPGQLLRHSLGLGLSPFTQHTASGCWTNEFPCPNILSRFVFSWDIAS